MFQALVYRDGNLVSGSLEALVQHMVPTEEYYPDRAYLFAFLLSARLFIKPHELLGEVCALCEHQQNLNGEGGKVSIDILSIYQMTRSFLPRLRAALLFHHKSMHSSSLSLYLLDLFFHLLGNINMNSPFFNLLSPLLLLYIRMKLIFFF